MEKRLAFGVLGGLVLAGLWAVGNSATRAAEADGALLAHHVYFTLKDHSAEAKKKLIDACKKYLTGHAGAVHFAVGTRAEESKGAVIDQDFDVGLVIVFKNKEALDKYHASERHADFVKAIKDSSKKVRVFDVRVEQ